MNQTNRNYKNDKKQGCKSETLCWNCKRIRNAEGCTCPWASEHKPVPGWTADVGITIDVPDLENPGEMITTRSWAVKECPMYIQNHKYLTTLEIFQAIADYFGKSVCSVKTNPRLWTVRYLDEKVEELPAWYMFYIYNGTEEN